MANEPDSTDLPDGQPVEDLLDAPAVETPAAAPSGPTQADFDTLRGQIGQLTQLVTATLTQRVPQQPQAPQRRQLTDADIQNAIEDGKGPQVIRQMIAEAQQDIVMQHIAPLQQQGLGAIAQLTRKAAQAEMPYYDRFKDEIDRHIQSLPPEAQLNPEAYILAHNYVAAQPQNLQRIIDEKVQEQVRRRGAAVGDLGEGAGRSRGAGPNTVPTPEEMFGAEVGNSIRQLGLTPDTWAKKLGYADWADYLKKTEMEEGNA